MTSKDIPKDILQILESVTAKRARTVIDHIIEHGLITTEDLKEIYGYNHPPRAARDVREQGIPLKTIKVKDSTGRLIGAYRFGDWEDLRTTQLGGRRLFSKQFKKELLSKHDGKCHICSGAFTDQYLQIDHRVPYEIVGEGTSSDRMLSDYMLICSSCNRAKSWSCEHCENWMSQRDPSVCLGCYWTTPTSYNHIAMVEIRRLTMIWREVEVDEYDQLEEMAKHSHAEVPEFVKNLLRKALYKS